MTTGIASGLGATCGLALEGTVGTFQTPTTWIPHNKADFELKKSPVVSQALRGSKFLLASRRNILSYTVDGSLEYDLATNQFGKLFQIMLGSTPTVTPQPGFTAAVLQTHTPGVMEGQALSIQKGIPAIPGGTIQAMSYAGNKITDWTITIARGGLANLQLTLDGWSEATATSYTAPTYLTGSSAPGVFSFNEGGLLVGGVITLNTITPSSTTGTAPTGVVSSVTIKGSNKLAADRFPLGAQTKKEQVSNGFTELTGEIEIEFATLADYYNQFKADTTVPLLFNLVGPTAIAGAFFPTIQIAVSAAKFEEGPVTETGPDIITAKVPFTAYDDGSGNTYQLQYISTDTTV
jgi:hypothetical protein